MDGRRTGRAHYLIVGFLPTLLVIASPKVSRCVPVVVYGVIGGALTLARRTASISSGYRAPPGSDIAREREVFAAAGIAGGLVYWLFAGRHAGSWK